MNPRLKVLTGVLVFVILAWGANALHLRSLETELDELGHAKVAEFREDYKEPKPQIAHIVTASKANLLFGDVTGKLQVYLQFDTGDDAKIEGFEFFYALQEDGWVQTESGRCTSEECTQRGLALIKKLNDENLN